MKIIRNNIIPFSGYKAMNLFGVLFVRGNARIDDITLNHEKIHSRQFVELMVLFAVATVLIRWWLPLFSPLFFYAWYVIEYLIHLARFKSHYLAYRRISFEREAYTHQTNINYLSKRELFSFFEYMG